MQRPGRRFREPGGKGVAGPERSQEPGDVRRITTARAARTAGRPGSRDGASTSGKWAGMAVGVEKPAALQDAHPRFGTGSVPAYSSRHRSMPEKPAPDLFSIHLFLT